MDDFSAMPGVPNACGVVSVDAIAPGKRMLSSLVVRDGTVELVIDFPHCSGKMYLWPEDCAVDHAQSALQHLAQDYDLYIATSAQDSSEAEIKAAFERVGPDDYVKGILL